MDFFDRASENERLRREDSIARNRVYQPLPDIGICYNCKDPLPVGMRFCDGNCRDDWDRREGVA